LPAYPAQHLSILPTHLRHAPRLALSPAAGPHRASLGLPSHLTPTISSYPFHFLSSASLVYLHLPSPAITADLQRLFSATCSSPTSLHRHRAFGSFWMGCLYDATLHANIALPPRYTTLLLRAACCSRFTTRTWRRFIACIPGPRNGGQTQGSPLFACHHNTISPPFTFASSSRYQRTVCLRFPLPS